MERLVVDLEKITFQENFRDDITENCGYSTLPVDCPPLLKFTIKNCLPNMTNCGDEKMPDNCPNSLFALDKEENIGDTDLNSADDNTSSDTCDEKIENEDENGSNEDMVRVRSDDNKNRRNLPERALRWKPERKRDLHIPMKPPKVSPRSTAKLSPAEIRKLYSNKKLTSFRPSKLETIFEEPQPTRARLHNFPSDSDSQVRLIGTLKLKRSLNCCDGVNINKSLVKQRRAKIKKNFGRRNAWKKMPLESFIEYMRKDLSAESEEEVYECNIQQPLAPNETPIKIPNANVEEEKVMRD